MKKTTVKLSCLSIIGFLSLAVLQTMGQGPDVNSFFNTLKNKVIDGVNQLQQWKTEAEAAARKTISDFTDCPSPAAQNLYNDLKQKRDRANQIKQAAEEEDRKARQARDNCKKVLPAGVCDAEYNKLQFRNWAAAAGATAASAEAAMNALKNLKCVSGCNRAGRIAYPSFLMAGAQTAVGVFRGSNVEINATSAGINVNNSTVATNRIVDISYCAAWNPGRFQASWDTGNGSFDAQVSAQLPSCRETKRIPCCSEWDLALVLPKLQKLNLIPPDVKVTDLRVSVPNKNITHISGVRAASCSQTAKVPKRLQQNGFITVTPSGSPLQVALGNYTVAEWTDIGCLSPAFGLEPVTNTASVPDITRVKFEWQGVKIKSGSVEVDMTKPDFKATCKKGCSSTVSVPDPEPRTETINLPWACLEPRFVNVVANP